ncbi:MAG TPA: hypothetical protein VLT47_02680 [Anaeromyxobacteraceae bacterium]|nr:hypothetical protein [Anaeromyxobacteraceae bacterium]
MGKLTYVLLALAGVFGISAVLVPTFRVVAMLGKVGASPVPATVAGAAPGRWVTLTDAELRCDTRAVKGKTTFFMASPRGGTEPFVAQFEGEVTCEAASASPSGVFLADRLTMADLVQFGLDTHGADRPRLFSALATPKYLRMVLVPYLAMLLIGVAITFWGTRGFLRAGGPRGR